MNIKKEFKELIEEFREFKEEVEERLKYLECDHDIKYIEYAKNCWANCFEKRCRKCGKILQFFPFESETSKESFNESRRDTLVAQIKRLEREAGFSTSVLKEENK
jgi:hypothetical protein